MNLGFRMHAERTPNPDSIKWVLGQPVAGDGASATFKAGVEPGESPLAAALLEVEGVAGVLLGSNFVTVTRDPAHEWTDLAPPIVERIKSWAASGEPGLGPDHQPAERGEESDTVRRIREILEQDVRPYVEQDGGEIVFAGFQDGVVEVYLRGACAGCPSSTITLKVGIESRLKQELPEVKEVVAL